MKILKELEKKTKKDLDLYAEENLGIKLDQRKKKVDLLKDIELAIKKQKREERKKKKEKESESSHKKVTKKVTKKKPLEYQENPLRFKVDPAKTNPRHTDAKAIIFAVSTVVVVVVFGFLALYAEKELLEFMNNNAFKTFFDHYSSNN